MLYLLLIILTTLGSENGYFNADRYFLCLTFQPVGSGIET